MKINGGCHCGNIEYTAKIDNQKVALCHCTDCQQMSGAPFRGVVFASEDDVTLKGTIKDYVKQSADSGTPRAQGFCPECGTHIYATSVGDEPKVYMFRIGTIEQRDQLTPTLEIWCDSRQSWVKPVDGANQIARQP